MKIEIKIIVDDHARILTNSGLVTFMKNNQELMQTIIRAVAKLKEEEKKPKRGRPKKK